MIEAKQIEFAAYAAWRNRVLAAAAGGFALSFSGLQVEVVRATPGLTSTWPPLMWALALGVFSAAVEMADNRLVAHRDGVPHTKWWARDEHFFRVHRWLHRFQVASVLAMTVAVIVSFFILTAFGRDVVRAALEAVPTP